MTMYIGKCAWCKDWKEVIHTFNYFGDPISVCRECLYHIDEKRGRFL